MLKIGLLGYGNLAKGIEDALCYQNNMTISAVFSRRNDIELKTKDAKIEPVTRLKEYAGKLDIIICCGGSKSDLMMQTPEVAKLFNFVDSFDNHAKIIQHFKTVDKIAKENNTVGIISAGWDPGLFSLQRLYGEAVLPKGATYTFWGKGVSQGHTEAIKKIDGVVNAVQYTVPIDAALSTVRSGLQPPLTAKTMHKRICYVVTDKNADKKRIEHSILSMPDYFLDYDTTVHFISEKDFKENHQGMPHGGSVFRIGETSENIHTIEYSLKLSKNPSFTGSVLVACAQAVNILSQNGETGARTLFDVPPSYLINKSISDLYAELL